MKKIKELIGIGRPGGLDDLIIRVVKTAIAAAVAAVAAVALGVVKGDVTFKAAAIVVLTAAATAAINAIQLALKPE